MFTAYNSITKKNLLKQSLSALERDHPQVKQTFFAFQSIVKGIYLADYQSKKTFVFRMSISI